MTFFQCILIHLSYLVDACVELLIIVINVIEAIACFILRLVPFFFRVSQATIRFLRLGWSWFKKYWLSIGEYILILLVVAIPAYVIWWLWNNPLQPLEHLLNQKGATLTLKSDELTTNFFLQRVRESHTLILTSVAGIVGIVGLVFGKLRLDHNRKELGQTQAEHRTQRFKDAVELLGHKEMDVRQGGIFALQQLMAEKPEDFGVTVCNLLASYVNHRGGKVSAYVDAEWITIEANTTLSDEAIQAIETDATLSDKAKRTKKAKAFINIRDQARNKALNETQGKGLPSDYPFTDILAALEALALRELPAHIEERVDFNLDNLNWTYFPVYKHGFNAYEVYASQALAKTKESRRTIVKTRVKNYLGADFGGAKLEQAHFSFTKQEKANFTFAKLQGAKFVYAEFKRAYFMDAELKGADFYRANIAGAAFEGAKGITTIDLLKTVDSYDELTLFPDGQRYQPATYEERQAPDWQPTPLP
jgi:uncharacterized protein YjbI with pentapeptide repeats